MLASGTCVRTASRALPLPIHRPPAQQQQSLLEHQAADADDDDGGVDVGEGEARPQW